MASDNLLAPSKLKPYSGIVGGFDILEYKNFVDNNSVEHAAEIVLRIEEIVSSARVRDRRQQSRELRV